MGVRVRTASQVKTWWSVENFDYTVNALNNCYECNTRGHLRRDCSSRGQSRLKNSNEEFNYMVNLLGHCWECNQSGHVRIKCPDLGQPSTSYRGGQAQDKDVRCLQPKKTRKEHKDLRYSRKMLRGYSGK